MRKQFEMFFRTFRGSRRKPLIVSLRTVLLLIITLGHSKVCESQGSFPLLINGAANKPISTLPEVGTCGQLTRSAFCRSSSLEESVSRCSIGYCNQDCPQRTTAPISSVLLTSLRGTCVSPDLTNVRPGSEPGSRSIIFQNSPDCYISPVVPVSGNNGELSISVWIRPDLSQDG